MNLGAVMRRARVNRSDKMSQDRLAALTNIDQGTISKLERDAAPWTVAQMVTIEGALELAPGFLLRGAGYLRDVLTVPDALANDPTLSNEGRRVVLAAYEAAVSFDLAEAGNHRERQA